MPALVLQARFAKEGRTVRVEIAGSWWPPAVFDREKADDQAANEEAYEAVKKALCDLGFREVDE